MWSQGCEGKWKKPTPNQEAVTNSQMLIEEKLVFYNGVPLGIQTNWRAVDGQQKKNLENWVVFWEVFLFHNALARLLFFFHLQVFCLYITVSDLC